jgi:hypothetical protein
MFCQQNQLPFSLNIVHRLFMLAVALQLCLTSARDITGTSATWQTARSGRWVCFDSQKIRSVDAKGMNTHLEGESAELFGRRSRLGGGPMDFLGRGASEIPPTTFSADSVLKKRHSIPAITFSLPA